MNKNVIIILVGAMVLAGIVAMTVSSKLTPKPTAAAEKKPTVEVLTANKILFTGQKVSAADVAWQAWPESNLYKGLIKKSDQPDPAKLEIYGSPLRHNIESGEPITLQSVISDAKDTFLSALLTPGMRAAAIAVGPTTGTGGFVSPGDYVDVVLTYTPKLSGTGREYLKDFAERLASQLILSNVKVLAVDLNFKTDKREAKHARTVTLEVTLENAQKLAVAEQMGTLYIFLRRLGEKDVENAPPLPLVSDITTSDIIKKSRQKSAEAQSSQQTTEVRLYSGNAITNLPVRQYSKEGK